MTERMDRSLVWPEDDPGMLDRVVGIEQLAANHSHFRLLGMFQHRLDPVAGDDRHIVIEEDEVRRVDHADGVVDERREVERLEWQGLALDSEPGYRQFRAERCHLVAERVVDHEETEIWVGALPRQTLQAGTQKSELAPSWYNERDLGLIVYRVAHPPSSRSAARFDRCLDVAPRKRRGDGAARRAFIQGVGRGRRRERGGIAVPRVEHLGEVVDA